MEECAKISEEIRGGREGGLHPKNARFAQSKAQSKAQSPECPEPLSLEPGAEVKTQKLKGLACGGTTVPIRLYHRYWLLAIGYWSCLVLVS